MVDTCTAPAGFVAVGDDFNDTESIVYRLVGSDDNNARDGVVYIVPGTGR